MSTGKSPKIGDQIVPPPATTVVTDPVPADPPPGPGPDSVPEVPPVVDVAGEVVEPLVLPPSPPDYPHILLEGLLTPIECNPRDLRQFRVTGLNGISYEHTSNAPDGTWLYREVR